MTRHDFTTKWAIYALALIPVLCLECFVLNRIPVFGVTPRLMPLAAVAVAVLEGPLAGAGFGLAVGIIADSMYPGIAGGMIFGLTLIGLGAGLLSRYVLHQNLISCLICSFSAFFIMDFLRILFDLMTHVAPFLVLLSLAGREIIWSLVFTPLIYFLFRWVHRRTSRLAV